MKRSKYLCAKCFVPSCAYTTTNSPRKVFVMVSERVKQKWCRQLNIKYNASRRIYCCKDHLNFEEDLENYQYWKIMKGKPILKSTAKLRHLTFGSGKTKNIENRDEYPVSSISGSYSNVENATESMSETMLLEPVEDMPVRRCYPENRPNAISTFTHPMRVDAAIQCNVQTMDRSTNTPKRRKPLQVLPSQSSEHIMATPTQSSTNSSLYGSISGSKSQTSVKDKEFKIRQQTMQFIQNKPKAYIGLPEQYFWLLDYIISLNLFTAKKIDLIIALFKLKLNDTATRTCEQFELSNVTYTKSLYSGIQVLASFFQNQIYMPTLSEIKKNLPLVFKIRYSNVQVILDTFEIEIEKPHDPVVQAQTLSQYKNDNTVKYLIGCVPNGFVSYVSKGYGGRISDKALVEKSNLIECLPSNSVIMADRGFKEIQSSFVSKGIRVLCPPSVYSSLKPTKEEVIQTKVIASSRVHIERVIRRVREFKFLKPHSVVSHKNVSLMDHMVVIACGLINLQDEIIKRN